MALQLLGFGNCITCQSAELDGGEPAPALGASGKALVPGCRVYSCSTCRSHTAEHNDIISKGFQGRRGRAYLFYKVRNVSLGQKEDRLLLTGFHTVRDVHCSNCDTILGWRYGELHLPLRQEQAFDLSQKYKEGKFIIEKLKMMAEF